MSNGSTITLIETDEVMIGQQQTHHYEEDNIAYSVYEGDC